MAKQVILSREASEERKSILSYWRTRNKSDVFSRKLDQIFRAHFELLQTHPKLGRPLGIKDLRALVVRDYLFIYKETIDVVLIVSIWDNRQNPERLSKKLKK